MPLPSPIELLLPLLDDRADLSVLQDEASWIAIREYAPRYGVAPLIAYAARLHVAPSERLWCDRILTNSWTHYERRLRQLQDVSGFFTQAGIRAIALKGPLLARQYYSPPFLRKPSLDLDFAVIEDDLERACEVLMKAGYLLRTTIADARIQSHHVELTHPSQHGIELHFRLSHRALGIPVNEFFDRAVSCTLPNGQEALVLSPADQLLHLVLHLSQSRFGTLFHLCEIRRVCRAEPIGVREEAVARAIRHHYCGAFRMLDIAFRAYWNEPFLPPGLPMPETWLNWRLTPRLYRTFEQWSVPGRALSLPARLQARWLDFQLTDRPADALRLASFFLKTAWFYVGEKAAWGTPRHLRFAPAVTVADDSASQTRGK